MKYFSLFFILFILSINFNKSFAEDALTIKQQLDRIMEEVKDLNKAVFNKSFDNEKLNSLDANIDTERFTSIDIRIYDLEKDIKNLTLQFEEIIFRLEDISNDMTDLESELISKLPVTNNVFEYAVNLVAKTRPNSEKSADIVRDYIEWGAGPRASQYMIMAAKCHAAINGKYSPDIDLGIRTLVYSF